MNQEELNRMRRMAGLAPSYNSEERKRLDETTAKYHQPIYEAANNRPAAKAIADIAREHLHVRSLEKSGDDNKDYHDCPCWAIEKALKAAFKAGQQAAPSKDVKESVEDKESSKESKAGGSKPVYNPKGGEKLPKEGKDAIVKGKKKEAVDEMALPNELPKEMQDVPTPFDENEEEYTSSYKKGAVVKCKGKTCIVHVPDAKADYIGVIPMSLENASEREKNANVDLVRINSVRPASEEDCEMSYDNDEVTMDSGSDEMGTMEGSSQGYTNPKGTKLKSDSKSGADAKKGNCYKDKPHKDNSMNAKSEDKGKKGLKSIGEANAKDATVWGKEYGRDDGRIDRNESPDQFNDDPNNDIKISVPSEYKKALKETIVGLRKESDDVRIRDPYGSDFYDNTALAFENLLNHLETGTRRSLLLAQIDLNRVMSPMTQRLPNEVYMYIVRGGKPAALTELFKEVKVKQKEGADLSKEDYTK